MKPVILPRTIYAGLTPGGSSSPISASIVGLLLLAALCACASTEQGEPGPPKPESAWQRTNASVHEKLAATALRRGDTASALANAREALRVDPGRPEALLVLARALLSSGSSPGAEAAARRALAVRPEWAEAWLALAESLLDQNREAEARGAYREAVDFGSTEAALVLGALELEQGRESSAVSVLAGRTGFGDPDCVDVLASHYWATGRSELAEDVLLRGLEHSPADQRLLWKLNQVRFSRDDHGAFLESVTYRNAVGRPPTQPERLLLAASLLNAGQGAQASHEYRRLASQHPEDGGLRLSLGEALLLEGDSPGAEAAFRAAVRLEDSERAGLFGIARVRMQAGRPQDAILPLQQAIELDPAHAPTRSLLVAAWVACGDLERAALEAEQVRLQSPGGELDHACRRLLERRGPAAADVDHGMP